MRQSTYEANIVNYMCIIYVRQPEYGLNIMKITCDICNICMLVVLYSTYSNTFATHLLHLQSHDTYICTLYLLVWPMYDTHDMNMM